MTTTNLNVVDDTPPQKPRLLGEMRDRIAASDPAFSRLRLALTAILSVFSSGLLLGLVTLVQPLPVAAYGIALVVSFLGSMAVRDKTAQAQLITRAYLGLSVTASVFVASLVSANPLLADIIFLCVIFGAVYIRKFGMRWFAVGMIAFMSFFMGNCLKPQPMDIGWIALGAAIALVVTHVMTNYVFRSDPERDFRRAVVTLDRRINVILRALLQLSQDGKSDQSIRKTLQRHLARLRDIVLMAEGFIPQGQGGLIATKGAGSDLAVALFDLQLVVERLVRRGQITPPSPAVIRAALHRNTAELQQYGTKQDEHDNPSDGVVLRVASARQQLDDMLASRPAPAFVIEQETPLPTKPEAGAAPEKSAMAETGIPRQWHLPIQVTLACAIAMSCGLLISQSRWYWAVITAFIVFNNTRSRADTAMKAFQRSMGTLAGLFVGTAVAIVFQGNMVAAAIGIPVLFFLAFYFLQVSYGVMIFFITIALALLYGLMGMFTPDILVIRLEETIVGGLAGALVAFLVFPSRTSDGVSKALGTYFEAMQKLVGGVSDVSSGKTPEENLLALSRELDRAYADLVGVARPMGGPWAAVTRFGHVREKLLLLSGGAHWARTLARSVPESHIFDAESTERIKNLADEISQRLEAGDTMKRSFFDTAPSARIADNASVKRSSLPVMQGEDPVLALEVISTILARATV